MAVYLDIYNFIRTKDYLKEYINIQLGNEPMTDDDYGKDIIQVITERRGIKYEECKNELVKEIKEIVQGNKEKWLDCLLNTEIYKHITDEKSTFFSIVENKEVPIYFSDEINKQIDYAKKYIVPRCKHPDIEFPENLQNLVNAQKANEIRLNELKKIKKKNVDEKKEYNKRIKYDISLFDDMEELKKHYGYETNHNVTISGDYSFDEKLDSKEDPMNEFILDSYEIEQIHRIAEKILTNKQLIIFKLYYESGFTHQEIGDITGDLRTNVTRDLGVIIQKIRKNMVI